MRLGGPVSGYSDPQAWVDRLKASGYTAAYFPLTSDDDPELVEAYVKAARRNDILIAEVGAWSNPLSPVEEERRKAIALCKRQLALADRVGARCCVNISGSRGSSWAGPHPLNMTRETLDLIVKTVREIIDSVQPTRTYYTLETMPWMYPDSTDSYLDLISRIDRERFAVHFDPVNLVSSPRLYYSNRDLISDFIDRLGPYIKSCHAKDVTLSEKPLVHLDEVRPGLGNLDYATLLDKLDALDRDTPLMLEHLSSEREYRQAASYIREVGQRIGIAL